MKGFIEITCRNGEKALINIREIRSVYREKLPSFVKPSRQYTVVELISPSNTIFSTDMSYSDVLSLVKKASEID